MQVSAGCLHRDGLAPIEFMPTASGNPDQITPAVHLEFIQNHLENGGASEAEIEKYHRALFLHHHALEWEKLRQETKIHEDRLGFLEGQLREARLLLGERP